MHDQRRLSVAVVGATGAVGRELLFVLTRRGFPMRDLRLLASDRSAGSVIAFGSLKDSKTMAGSSSESGMQGGGKPLPVEVLTHDSFVGIDLAFFCAGGQVSRQYAPLAIEAGATIIDTSSAFRMDTDVPLIVPEVNGHALNSLPSPSIIANPNCSTIIALMAVAPLHRSVGVQRMVIATYQAASGGGAVLMNELEKQAHDFSAGRPLQCDILGKPYLFNVFNHNSAIGSDGSNEEEAKLVRESHKLLNDDSIGITATCVRVPVLRSHCEAINLTLRDALSEGEARDILRAAPGVRIVDDRAANHFPEPIEATGKDDILVGRIRADASQPPGKGLNLFIAGDQLRKGAALNAVQIAEFMLQRPKSATPARPNSIRVLAEGPSAPS